MTVMGIIAFSIFLAVVGAIIPLAMGATQNMQIAVTVLDIILAILLIAAVALPLRCGPCVCMIP
jgi:hypothetical protein